MNLPELRPILLLLQLLLLLDGLALLDASFLALDDLQFYFVRGQVFDSLVDVRVELVLRLLPLRL